MKTNNGYSTAITAAITAVVVSATCTVAIHFFWPSPEWRASGDGKTIFSAKTGELRDTSSGRSIVEVQAEKERVANEENERRQEELERRQKEVDSYLRDGQVKREAARKHNLQQFYKVKKFVDANPKVEGIGLFFEWDKVTKPFRTFTMLSRDEHAALLDFLGRAVTLEPYKSNPDFPKAIEDLRAWDAAGFR